MPIATAAPQGPSKQQTQSYLKTTPGLLQASIVIVLVLALIVWAAAHLCIGAARSAVQTIGKDAVPSIIAAQQVRANLADMDANADNGFFSRGTREAKAAYEKDRKTAADMLVTAAQNITYGNEERSPILTLTDGVQEYVGDIESARTLGYPKGLDVLRAASGLMHERLLPAADALDKANFSHLDQTYNASKAGIPLAVTALWVLGIVLIGALVAIQVFLLMRMKRILNVPLCGATVILVLWLLATGNTVRSIQNDLRIAKEDGFDSIDALWKTRAVAYDANGDESLYLLESGSRGEADAVHQSELLFKQNAALIADSPLTDDIVAQAQTAKPAFKGYLGDELRNITFDGEQEAAGQALKTYAAYMKMDAHIRELETSGRHQEAVDFCTGNQEGQSNWGFAQFDSALQKVIDINQHAFDNAIAHGFRGLNWLPSGAVIVPLIVVGLCWLGLIPRLREYSHS